MKYNEPTMSEPTDLNHDESWWEAVLADEKQHARGAKTPAKRDGATQHKPVKSDTGVNWKLVLKLFEEEKVVNCQVVGHNRGGLLVEGDGFQGFVPISHLVEAEAPTADEQRDDYLARYVERCLRLRVIECDPQRGRVVLSERAAQTAPGQRQHLFDTLSKGDKLSGEVTNVTDFGVFVDLGGVEGLVHISELSWGRVSHPGEFLEVGKEVEVMVLNVDCGRGRVALSIKRLHSNPWETAGERYGLDEVTEVVITEIVRFGAFARLEEGLEGLIHVSEMGMPGLVDPWEVLHEGQRVQARVLQIDAERQRMSLRLEGMSAEQSDASVGSDQLMEGHG